MQGSAFAEPCSKKLTQTSANAGWAITGRSPGGVARNAHMHGNSSCASSRRRLTFPYNRGKYGLIFYCLKLKNLIVRDTLFVKRIPFYKFVDLFPRSYAGDNDPAGSRDPGTGDEELAGLISLIEEVSVRLSNTFDFLNGNLVIVENEKHGKYDRARSDFTHDFSHQKRIRSPAQPKPNFTLPMQITLEIDDTTASLLATLSESGSVTSVVETLIDHAAQGVTAEVVTAQVFGYDFVDKLEPGDPFWADGRNSQLLSKTQDPLMNAAHA
jgi:hypothetical protein